MIGFLAPNPTLLGVAGTPSTRARPLAGDATPSFALALGGGEGTSDGPAAVARADPPIVARQDDAAGGNPLPASASATPAEGDWLTMMLATPAAVDGTGPVAFQGANPDATAPVAANGERAIHTSFKVVSLSAALLPSTDRQTARSAPSAAPALATAANAQTVADDTPILGLTTIDASPSIDPAPPFAADVRQPATMPTNPAPPVSSMVVVPTSTTTAPTLDVGRHHAIPLGKTARASDRMIDAVSSSEPVNASPITVSAAVDHAANATPGAAPTCRRAVTIAALGPAGAASTAMSVPGPAIATVMIGYRPATMPVATPVVEAVLTPDPSRSADAAPPAEPIPPHVAVIATAIDGSTETVSAFPMIARSAMMTIPSSTPPTTTSSIVNTSDHAIITPIAGRTAGELSPVVQARPPLMDRGSLATIRKASTRAITAPRVAPASDAGAISAAAASVVKTSEPVSGVGAGIAGIAAMQSSDVVAPASIIAAAAVRSAIATPAPVPPIAMTAADDASFSIEPPAAPDALEGTVTASPLARNVASGLALAAPAGAAAMLGRGTPVIQPAVTARPSLGAAASPAPVPAAAPPAVIAPAGEVFAAAIHAAGRDQRGDGRDRYATASPTGVVIAAATSPDAVAAIAERGDAGLDLRRDGWPAAMVDHIERLRDAADATDTRVRLVPDALGSIDVSLSRHDGGGVSVTLAAHQPATQALLADARPQLVDLAQARGIRLTDADAGGAGGGAGAAGQGFADAQRQPPPAPSRAPAAARPAASFTDDRDPADSRVA